MATTTISPEERLRQQLSQSLNIPQSLIPSGLLQQTLQMGQSNLSPQPLVTIPLVPSPTPTQPSPTIFAIGDRVIMTEEGIRQWGNQSKGGEGVVSELKPAFDFDLSVTWDEPGTIKNSYTWSQVKHVSKVKKELVKKTVPFKSVVISDEKREEIQAAISQFENAPKLFTEWGFEEVFEKGTAVTLLFWGIPGSGKTLMAQAIAEELDAELKTYGMAEIGSSEPGGSERFIQKLFKEAKDFFTINKKQRVILFDECDALLYDRNKVGVILGAQINTLLTEIERHDGIVIFTTNRLSVLDPALERRIAAKIEFPFPTREQRVAIWKRMIPKKAPIAKDVNFKELAMYPLPGGNIKNAVLNAARMAVYKKQKHITMNNFVQAIEKEAQSQAEFEANYDRGNEGRGWSTKPISAGDYSMGESRKLSVDSVFNRKAKA